MPTIPFIYEDDEGEEHEVDLPAIWVVCPNCCGEGNHVDPRIDGNGFTQEDWEQESHEFREDYMRGAYNIRCEECHGKRVVPEVDENTCNPEVLKIYYDHLEDEAEYARICMMEQRYGC